MATIGFLTLDKISGSGNGTVRVTAPKRTDKGRGARKVMLKVSAVNSAVEVSKIVTVQQAGEAIQIFEFGPGGTRPGDNAVQLDGTKAVTYSDVGETNSGKFYVWVKRVTSLYDEDISSGEAVTSGVRVVHHYTSEQFSINHEGNGLYSVKTDYGFDASYRFVVEVDLPANPTTAINYYRISVCTNSTPEESDTVFHSFGRQSAGMAKLTVTPETLDLAYGGSSGNLTITSNDSWTIEQVEKEEGPTPELTKMPTPQYKEIVQSNYINLTHPTTSLPDGLTDEQIEVSVSPNDGTIVKSLIFLIALQSLTPSTQYTIKIRFKGDGVTTADSDWQTLILTTKAESSSGGDTPEAGGIKIYGFSDMSSSSTFTKGDSVNMAAAKLNGLGNNQGALLVEIITTSRTLNIASSDFSVLDAGNIPYAFAYNYEPFASYVEEGRDLTLVQNTNPTQMEGSFDSTSAALTIPGTVSPDSEGRFVVMVAFRSSHAWTSATPNGSISFEAGDAEAVANITVN